MTDLTVQYFHSSIWQVIDPEENLLHEGTIESCAAYVMLRQKGLLKDESL